MNVFRRKRKYEDRFNAMDLDLRKAVHIMEDVQERISNVETRIDAIESQNKNKLVTIALPEYDSELDGIRQEIKSVKAMLPKSVDVAWSHQDNDGGISFITGHINLHEEGGSDSDVPVPAIEGAHDDNAIQSF